MCTSLKLARLRFILMVTAWPKCRLFLDTWAKEHFALIALFDESCWFTRIAKITLILNKNSNSNMVIRLILGDFFNSVALFGFVVEEQLEVSDGDDILFGRMAALLTFLYSIVPDKKYKSIVVVIKENK